MRGEARVAAVGIKLAGAEKIYQIPGNCSPAVTSLQGSKTLWLCGAAQEGDLVPGGTGWLHGRGPRVVLWEKRISSNVSDWEDAGME